MLEPLRDSITKALARQTDERVTSLLGGIPVHVKPELPPLSLFMRGGGPNAHIETDSMETANTLVECANANGGQITYEMLVDFYKKTLENKPRFVGLDLSNKADVAIPWRDTGALHEKRNSIVAEVAAELQAENESWKTSDDCTGEGPAPRRLADGGEIIAPKDYLVGERSGCDLFSYPPQQKPATTERRSIDDCSPQEWYDASRATYARIRSGELTTAELRPGWLQRQFDNLLPFLCLRCHTTFAGAHTGMQEPTNPVETTNTNPTDQQPSDASHATNGQRPYRRPGSGGWG